MQPESPIVLEARGITKTFTSTQPPAQVLRGIDFHVRRGEFVAVMGASGSGKSTLLFSVSGMDRPTTGTIALDGRDLTDLSDDEMSRVRLTSMGFVFQQAYLLENLSVRDNILLPALKAVAPDARTRATARVDDLMARFGIDHVGDHGIHQVSGGQLQRASICRALGVTPSLLFADEPTGALNSSTAAEVMDALSSVHAGGTAIVMVTHSPSCAARADRVVYLRDGLLVDAIELGTWRAVDGATREDALRDWLGANGF